MVVSNWATSLLWMRLLLPSVVVSTVVVSLLVDSVMVAIGPFMIAAAIKYSDRNVCSELYLISGWKGTIRSYKFTLDCVIFLGASQILGKGGRIKGDREKCK